MSDVVIRPIAAADSEQIGHFLRQAWGDIVQVRKGEVLHPDQYPGFIAYDEQRRWIGLVTYQIRGGKCEIATLNSLCAGSGVGTALTEAVKAVAQQAGCTCLWLITTNDNLHALRFYQKRGFMLSALYPNALEISRKLKPHIPLIGNDGIPLRDEIELSMPLSSS